MNIKYQLVVTASLILLKKVLELTENLGMPKRKRRAFEKMKDGLEEFADFILDIKKTVEDTPEVYDDEVYKISKEAFKSFLDEGQKLYEKM